jgi:peptidoglycan/LPS O-acetylase OafA/YrhL
MTLANSFDVLRLFAALLVVYGHAYPLTGANAPQFMGNTVQAIGVKIFFIISGYLIVGSWARDPHIVRFAQRRAFRILPGLAVVVAISALVLGPLITALPLNEYLASSQVRSYFSNIAFKPQYDLPGVFTANPYPVAVNGSLWSLPAEVAMYVIGPLAFFLGGRLLQSPRAGVTCATLALTALAIWFVRISPPGATPVVYGSSVLSFLDVAPYFLIGSLYSVHGWDRKLDVGTACAAWVALTLLQPSGIWAEIALYLVLPYAILSLGTRPTRFGSWLSARGDISYGVYLYGFPLQQMVAALLPAGRAPLMNAVLTLLPLLTAASLSWVLVERPMLRFKPRAGRGLAWTNKANVSSTTS